MKKCHIKSFYFFIYLKFFSISEDEKFLLINADRYLLISGHRNYFYQQKDYYINEIQRITELYDNSRYKKNNYKKECLLIKKNMETEVDRLIKEIKYFRERVNIYFFKNFLKFFCRNFNIFNKN